MPPCWFEQHELSAPLETPHAHQKHDWFPRLFAPASGLFRECRTVVHAEQGPYRKSQRAVRRYYRYGRGHRDTMTDASQNVVSSRDVGAVIAHRWAQHLPEHPPTRRCLHRPEPGVMGPRHRRAAALVRPTKTDEASRAGCPLGCPGLPHGLPTALVCDRCERSSARPCWPSAPSRTMP